MTVEIGSSLFVFDLVVMAVTVVLGLYFLTIAIFPNSNKSLFYGLALGLGTIASRIGETYLWAQKGPQLRYYQSILYLIAGAVALTLLAFGLYRLLEKSIGETPSRKKFSEGLSLSERLANWGHSAQKAQDQYADECSMKGFLHKLPEYRRVEIEEIRRGRKATDEEPLVPTRP